MHGALSLGLIIMLIGFAFGERVARIMTGAGLITIAAFLFYVMWRIVEGTI